MSTGSWQQVWDVFEEALSRPADARQTFLDECCGHDKKMRQAVEDLLAADRETDTFLDQGAFGRSFAPLGGPGAPEEEDRAGKTARDVPDGTTIGPYRILRRVGQGGMSIVYLAVRADDAYRRRVVVKLIRPGMESAAIQERLRTERQILASLDHPYIARLYDGGTTEDGLPYFVLEYVEGVPLDTYCDENRLSIEERLVLFGKVCEAVGYAHQNLVVHRDLKPSNILVTAGGEPRLLDFGIAKVLNPELVSADLEPTATWHQMLTPSYASPEQIRGKLITTASDVYSLGVLLYKLFTGRLPRDWTGRSMHEIESLLTDREPLPPSAAVTRDELGRQLKGDLDAIVLKALRSVPRQRYSSVEQMSGDIERYRLGRPVEARAGTWRYRAGKFVRRHRKLLAGAAAVFLLVLAFTGALVAQAIRVAYERDQARQERDKKAEVLSLVLELFKLSNPYVAPGKELTVREALERSVPILHGALDEQPEVRAELLHTAGSILNVLGASEAARGQLEEALDLRRRLYGEKHPDYIESLTVLSTVHLYLGELEVAEEQARQAVALARELPDAGSVELVGPLTALVSVLCSRNELEAAEGPAIEALGLLGELPADQARRISVAEYLARIKSAKGEYGESARLNRQAIAERRARYGEKHPAQIATLNNLGVSLRRLGEFDAAERTYREALALQRENFGEERLDPFLLNNLAGVRYALGDYEGALETYGQAAEVIGRDQAMAFFVALRLERTRIRLGAAADAEENLRRLLDRWSPELGQHWWIAEGRGILGESLSVQGRCAEAEPLLLDSFEVLLEQPKERTRSDAFERLSEHFERCGESREVPRYKAMLEAAGR